MKQINQSKNTETELIPIRVLPHAPMYSVEKESIMIVPGITEKYPPAEFNG